MSTISKILVGLLAFEHMYILWIEMFAWTTKGKETFKSIPEDMFEKTTMLAANQGLYNGFLAVGLLWSIFIPNPVWSKNIAIYFALCILVAGIYGSISSSSKSVFLKQGIPATLTLLSLIIF